MATSAHHGAGAGGPGMSRSGVADLPLHGGRVPPWLATRMARLGRVMVEALVHHHGRVEVLRRLSNPFWFQSLGSVMGMDWHSSGITTSVLGALKRGLQPVSRELGIHVCGGRGRYGRRTPDELRALGESTGLPAEELVRASRLVGKVDSAAIQDGFSVYVHGFVVTDDGAWTVVQQGMNPQRRQARRYHWIWDRAGSFVEQPHAAIDGTPREGSIVNLTDLRAAAARAGSLVLATGDPTAVTAVLARAATRQLATDHLVMPAHHEVRAEDIDLRRLGRTLQAVAARGPVDFPALLLEPGVGARTLFALALVAELVHGAPSRFADPARFSLAHGGKDGHPFPVPLRVYDHTLRILRDAVTRAKLGNDDRLSALSRLDAAARAVDALADGGAGREPDPPTPAQLAGWIGAERAARAELGGRTVFDDHPAVLNNPARAPTSATLSRRRPPARPRQLSLPGTGRDRSGAIASVHDANPNKG